MQLPRPRFISLMGIIRAATSIASLFFVSYAFGAIQQTQKLLASDPAGATLGSSIDIDGGTRVKGVMNYVQSNQTPTS